MDETNFPEAIKNSDEVYKNIPATFGYDFEFYVSYKIKRLYSSGKENFSEMTVI